MTPAELLRKFRDRLVPPVPLEADQGAAELGLEAAGIVERIAQFVAAHESCQPAIAHLHRSCAAVVAAAIRSGAWLEDPIHWHAGTCPNCTAILPRDRCPCPICRKAAAEELVRNSSYSSLDPPASLTGPTGAP